MINWLPTYQRVGQCINTVTYNFVNNTCPYYLNEIFESGPHCRIGTRDNISKLKSYFFKTKIGQKTVSDIGPSIWSSLPNLIKTVTSLNTFNQCEKALSDLYNT